MVNTTFVTAVSLIPSGVSSFCSTCPGGMIAMCYVLRHTAAFTSVGLPQKAIARPACQMAVIASSVGGG